MNEDEHKQAGGITIEEAKHLLPGDELFVPSIVASDGTATRWRVNGKPKTWKTRADDVKVPVKHGLYNYGYLDPSNIHLFVVRPDLLARLQERMSE